MVGWSRGYSSGGVGGLERPPPGSRPQRMTATHNNTKKVENDRAFVFELWIYVKVQARWDAVVCCR